MKFKDSKNWGQYPKKYTGQDAIDIIASVLIQCNDESESVEISKFIDSDKTEVEKLIFTGFEGYGAGTEAYKALANTDLSEIEYIKLTNKDGSYFILNYWKNNEYIINFGV